jgi:hypothetical protein
MATTSSEERFPASRCPITASRNTISTFMVELRYASSSVLQEHSSQRHTRPDHGDLDILAEVLPAAKRRGMKVICWLEDVFRTDLPKTFKVILGREWMDAKFKVAMILEQVVYDSVSMPRTPDLAIKQGCRVGSAQRWEQPRSKRCRNCPLPEQFPCRPVAKSGQSASLTRKRSIIRIHSSLPLFSGSSEGAVSRLIPICVVICVVTPLFMQRILGCSLRRNSVGTEARQRVQCVALGFQPHMRGEERFMNWPVEQH